MPSRPISPRGSSAAISWPCAPPSLAAQRCSPPPPRPHRCIAPDRAHAQCSDEGQDASLAALLAAATLLAGAGALE